MLSFGRFFENLLKFHSSSLLKNMSTSVKKNDNNNMFNPIFIGNFILLVLFLRGKKWNCSRRHQKQQFMVLSANFLIFMNFHLLGDSPVL